MLLYIDPGTGSMLFTILIGLVSTIFFFIRKLVLSLKFRLSAGNDSASFIQSGEKIIIFNESNRYWNVFKPICEEFESRKTAVAYWTAEEDDPCFSQGYRFVKPVFIGSGNKAYAKLNMASADICLATTPGLDVYQWRRSKNIKYYVHIEHGIGSANGYRMFGIDFFDSVLLSNELQIDEIRKIEALRNLKPKDLRIIGATFMDEQKKKREAYTSDDHDGIRVLLAPSWGSSSIFYRFGGKLIDALIATGYEIIIRPHPQSLISDLAVLEPLQKAYPDSEKLTWNYDDDNYAVLSKADIMITDFSSIIFDFSLIFDKPVIYTEDSFDPAPYDAAWIDEKIWIYDLLPKLGFELQETAFPELKDRIYDAVFSGTWSKSRKQAKDIAWHHIGEGARLTVDYLLEKLDSINTGLL